MRLHRFFIDFIIDGKDKFEIADARLLHQWRNVFRMKAGDSVILFDGSGSDYICHIDKLSKDGASLCVTERKPSVMPTRGLVMYAAIAKKDKFEWIVEKGTELGVSAFAPIIAERTEKQSLNMERLRKIAIEAAEQCGRGDIPEIREPIKFADAVPTAPKYLVACDLSGTVLGPEEKDRPISLFIGPEGGFTEKELSLLRANKASIIRLGKATLRAETAAIVGAAMFLVPHG